MSKWQRLEQRFTDGLRLSRRPVAVAFLEHVPAKVLKFRGSEPSGCSFWRLAADGHVFYTVPADHYNCAIGSYTHNIPLPPERAPEMEQTLGFMFTTGYLRTEDRSARIGRPRYVRVGFVREELVLLGRRSGGSRISRRWAGTHVFQPAGGGFWRRCRRGVRPG